MKSESERYLGLLERRLSLLEALSATLAASRSDFISMDIEAIQARIGEQEQFCRQIGALDGDITKAQIRCAALTGRAAIADEIAWTGIERTEPELSVKIGDTMRRVAKAQIQLKQLNDSHAALLRRSQRTIHVLLNLFQSHAPTYAAQPSPATGMMCEERV